MIGSSGVPVGTQVATPVNNSSGWPLEVTRVAPTVHCAVTQGPGEGGTNGQPATVQGPDNVTEGAPDSSRFGFGTVGIAWPPCEHVTVAPTCRTNPGTVLPSFFVRLR
jgi:hypothetical protein